MRKSVLVIDDDRKLCSLLSDYLGDSGFEVISAPNAEDGLRCLAQYRPAIVILDVMLPGMDGFETSQKLREGGFSGAIIACTANTTDQVEERCLASGMNDYMAKPISLKGLTLITERWLENAAT